MQYDQKEKYLKSIRDSCIKMLNYAQQAQVNEMEFIYSTIFNRDYIIYNKQFVELHINICRELIYGHNLRNIEQALKILQLFFYFFIGSEVAVNDFLQSSDNIWDSFFNMNAFIFEQRTQQALLQKTSFDLIAQLSGKKNLIQEVQQIEQKIQETFNINNVIKILIQIVFKDNQILEYTQKQHWIRSYRFLQNLGLFDQIKDNFQLIEFNIIHAYLTQDYNYISQVKDLPQNDLINIIYSLIHVDYKQISEYISKLSANERNQTIKKINGITLESQTNKIIQFGRGLKKICAWEDTINMYKALIKSGQQEIRQKYLVYLYYTISKLQLLRGEIFQCLENSQFALNEIEANERLNQPFQQHNPKRIIKAELWIIQLVAAYIMKKKNKFEIILEQIKQNLSLSDSKEQKRNFNILYQLFVEKFEDLIKSKIQTAENTYKQIRSIVEQNIKQRGPYLKNQDPSFYANIQIHKKSQCLLELFIISQLVDIDWQMVYYLNSEYVPLFLIIIKIKDLINVQNVAKIFYFFGDHEKSLQLAERFNDIKLIADIHFAQMNDILAISYYQTLQDEDSYYQLGQLYLNIFYTNNQQEFKTKAQQYFKKATDISKVYKQIVKIKLAQINNQDSEDKSKDIVPQIQINQPKTERVDILFFYNEVKQMIPFYNKLSNQIEQFLFTTERYKIPSKILIEQMKVDKHLGRGSFGKVKKVNFQGEVYALKISSFRFNSKTQIFRQDTLQSLCSRINELNILSYIQEYKIPYIIINKHVGMKFKNLNDDGLKCIKIFNLTPIYQEFSVIQEQSNQIKIQFAEKVAICLKQLQSKCISHQDIKPENILVDDNLNPVLIDFGTSISNFRSTVHGSSLFSYRYVDPELEFQDRKCRKNDVYSFGITLYDLFTCKRPYFDDTQATDVEFLQHKTHQNEINNIQVPEIQQLIVNCSQTKQSERYSLNQVLYHFLIMNKCRMDIQDLLKLFMTQFEDIDISEQEYELIKEFQQISQQMQQLDESLISEVNKINDTLFRCQYLNNDLLFYKFQILIQDKQLAFRQILQCIKFIRNLVFLNRKNVSNIGQFYNYILQIQNNGQEILIQFYIFIFDDGYKSEYIRSPKELISLLQTIQQIIDNGIFMMALDSEFLLLSENNTPILLNFLYSQRLQDDKLKNQYGWYYQQTKQDDPSVENEVQQILGYFQKILNDFKRKSQIYKASDHIQFQKIIKDIIDKEKQFQTVNSIIKYLAQQKITQIVQNPTTDSIRYDIKQFCQIASNYFVPKYPKLQNYIENFLKWTKRYKIDSNELNNGMKIDQKRIGKGNYGIVNKVLYDGKFYAQKISTILYKGNQVEMQQLKVLKTRINEINILSEMQDLNVPYVLKNIHVGFIFETWDGISSIKIYNLTPIYRPFTIIQNQKVYKIMFQYAQKVALCLKQLQMRNISHQDIKPDNLMVDENLDPVIIDFGISVSSFKSESSESSVFTLKYSDPELFNEGSKNRKNDVYSFGITLFELFTCSNSIYQQGTEFLQIQSHQENIKSIKVPEIQYLIIKCAQAESKNRFSLCQVLYQCLITNLCRRDIRLILILLMDQFDDIDITEQEYELIMEFQEISLLIPQMDSEEIKQVQQLNDNLYKCQYQDTPLVFNKYEIIIQDNKQMAFRQLLQCMRFVRNLVNLNKRNVLNISQFYNYRLLVQNIGQYIQLEIYSYDNNYQIGQLTNQQQLINLFKTIQQIHQNGIFMMNLKNDTLLYQNDTPLIIDFLYSFRQKDDLLKNQYGWPCQNSSFEVLTICHELQMIKMYFESLYSDFSKILCDQENNQLKQELLRILETFSDFNNIESIRQYLLLMNENQKQQ